MKLEFWELFTIGFTVTLTIIIVTKLFNPLILYFIYVSISVIIFYLQHKHYISFHFNQFYERDKLFSQDHKNPEELWDLNYRGDYC